MLADSRRGSLGCRLSRIGGVVVVRSAYIVGHVGGGQLNKGGGWVVAVGD